MVRSQEPSSLQLAAGVRLKTLPFYTVHGVLVPPTILGTQGAGRFQNSRGSKLKLCTIIFGRFQEATLQFVLTCQQATDIASNRDISQGSKMEYPYQVTSLPPYLLDLFLVRFSSDSAREMYQVTRQMSFRPPYVYRSQLGMEVNDVLKSIFR